MYYNIDIKLQNKSEFTKSHHHNARLEGQDKNDNVDQERLNDNYYLVGGNENPIDTINKKIAETKKDSYHKGIRKDANLAVSFVFSASPEFFFDFKKLKITREKWDSVSWQEYETNANGEKVKKSKTKLAEHRRIISDAWQTVDEKKIKQFENEVLEHLKTQHKENLIDVVCHRDEKNFHIHARTACIVNDKKTGKPKLSSKEYYRLGTLAQWRNDLSERMQRLKLTDKKPLQAPSLDEHEYKQAVTIEPVKTQKRVPQIELKKGLLGYKNDDVEKFISNSMQREKALKTENENLRKELQKQEPKIANANVTLKQLEKSIKEKDTMERKFRKITEQDKEDMRSIPCEDVLQSMGYIGKVENSTIRFKNEEFNIVIQKSTNKFFDNDSMNGGQGAIDLLMNIFKLKYLEAVDTLSNKFNIKDVAKIATKKREELSELVEKGIEAQQAELPKESTKEFNIETVKNYLTNTRKINPSLVDDLFNKGLIYADSKNNCIFTNKQKTFAFIRGTYKAKRYVANRGKVDFLKYDFNKSNSKDVYLFESAIDALSFRTSTNKDGEYIVLNGNGMISRVAELQLENKKVNLCFDNDEQGKAFCDKLSKQFDCNIYKPKGKDFNEDLSNGNSTEYKPIATGNSTNPKAVGGKTSEASTNSTDRDKQTHIKIR